MGSPKTATIEPMRLILLILVFVSSILLASTTASAGISTKKHDILKLIGPLKLPTASLPGLRLMEKTMAGLEKVGMLVSTKL